MPTSHDGTASLKAGVTTNENQERQLPGQAVPGETMTTAAATATADHESVEAKHRILIVDDEPTIAAVIQAYLARQWDVTIATSGKAALEILETAEPFSVVLSDFQMPGMDGLEFLTRVQAAHPLSTRVMMTGTVDFATAVNSLNSGAIFRFVCKPIEPAQIIATANDALKQHCSVTAEKEVLNRTLSGTIAFVNEMLSTLRPIEYGIASRAAVLIKKILAHMSVDNEWELVISTMLSQSATVLLPDTIIEKLRTGQPLTYDEQVLQASYPKTCERLVARIPRLGRVARIIGALPVNDRPVQCGDDQLCKDAKLVCLALDYVKLTQGEKSPADALRLLQAKPQRYEAEALVALEKVIPAQPVRQKKEVTVSELMPGMVLNADVLDKNGRLLVAKGTELTEVAAVRLRAFHRGTGVREPLQVTV